jgi:hypothetical protein
MPPMNHAIEPGKEALGNGEALQRVTTESTLGESVVNEALDAEANIIAEDLQPPQRSEKFEDQGPPPNGGLRAWLQVLGSFFLFFNSWVSLPAPCEVQP